MAAACRIFAKKKETIRLWRISLVISDDARNFLQNVDIIIPCITVYAAPALPPVIRSGPFGTDYSLIPVQYNQKTYLFFNYLFQGTG